MAYTLYSIATNVLYRQQWIVIFFKACIDRFIYAVYLLLLKDFKNIICYLVPPVLFKLK